MFVDVSFDYKICDEQFASCFPFSSFSLYAIPLFLLTPLPIVLSLSLYSCIFLIQFYFPSLLLFILHFVAPLTSSFSSFSFLPPFL